MGIDDLDKTWWERNVSEPYLKEQYETLPYQHQIKDNPDPASRIYMSLDPLDHAK